MGLRGYEKGSQPKRPNADITQSWKKVPTLSKSALVRALVEAADGTNMSYNKLCKVSGISRVTLHKWKVGKSYPRLLDFEALANSVGYTVTLQKMES